MIPNRGCEFSCSLVRCDISAIQKKVVRDNFSGPRGAWLQKGWPLPSRDSNQILDQVNQVNHGDQNVFSPFQKDNEPHTCLQPQRVAVRSGDPRRTEQGKVEERK